MWHLALISSVICRHFTLYRLDIHSFQQFESFEKSQLTDVGIYFYIERKVRSVLRSEVTEIMSKKIRLQKYRGCTIYDNCHRTVQDFTEVTEGNRHYLIHCHEVLTNL